MTCTTDKKSSNDIISGGKIFMNVREWPQQGSFIPSYGEAEPFLIRAPHGARAYP